MQNEFTQRDFIERPAKEIYDDPKTLVSLCHAMNEPILITGEEGEDFIVMSRQTYSGMYDNMQLAMELLIGELDMAQNPTIPFEDAMAELRKIACD